MTKKTVTAAIALLVLGAAGFGIFKAASGSQPAAEQTAEQTENSYVYAGEDDEQYRDTDSILVVVNKKHPLPAGYEPQDLVRPDVEMVNDCYVRSFASGAVEKMFAAAEEDGVHLILGSAYRGEVLQRQLYDSYVSQYGQSAADYISSRPGYSDHQTGLAIDVSDHDTLTYLTEDFDTTPEGQWLLEHAYEYGFILRYPKGKEESTGYSYEPWHYRYVGEEAAAAIYNNGSWLSLEEYCQVEGGDYGE